MKYRARIADEILRTKLESTGAVLIEGPKWCGKTTTGLQKAKSVLYMQNPKEKKKNLTLAALAPEELLVGDVPRMIDEWQLAPGLWDAVRFEVDMRTEVGQFILTGSAVPAERSLISHTGTGRFSRLKMRTMSLFESGESSGEVSLAGLFETGGEYISGHSSLELRDIAFLIRRGGWPFSVGKPEYVALNTAVSCYDEIVESDIARVDGVNRSADITRRILRSLARNVGTQAKLTEIRKDIIANEEAFSMDTLTGYLSALKKIFVIEDAEAWNPNIRSKTAIRSSDTRYFADPSIAAVALNLDPDKLIHDPQTLGFFFENLAIRDLRVYAESFRARVYHYRDKSELECDAVISAPDGSFGLIEIKLGSDDGVAEGVRNLNRFEERLVEKPAFKMVLTAIGEYAYRNREGVLIVPIGTLKN